MEPSSVRFVRDDGYLRESFVQWLFFRSRTRWFMVMAVVAIAVATWMFWARPLQGRLGLEAWVLLIVGAWELFASPWLSFRRWRRRALVDRKQLPDLFLRCEDGGLLFVGEGDGGPKLPVTEWVRVWRGWLVYTMPAKFIYLPDRWSRQDGVQAVLQRVLDRERT